MAKGSLRVNGIIVDVDGEIKASTGDSIVIREDDGSAVIIVDTNGKVGIGSSAPTAKLEIGDPGSGTSSQFRVLGNDTDSYFDLSNGSNDSIDVKLTKSDGTTNLFINGHTGKVGFGTTAPNETLELSSTSPQIRLTDTDGGYSKVSGVDGNIFLQADEGNTQASSKIDMKLDGTTRLLINTSGIETSTTTKIKQKGAFLQSSTHQTLTLGY